MSMVGNEERPVYVSYGNYPDCWHEMNKVLESNVWVMDIV